MLFSLVLSMVLGNGVVMNERIDSGLSHEQCINSSFQLQDIADDELESGEYNIVATKAFCILDVEKPHE